MILLDSDHLTVLRLRNSPRAAKVRIGTMDLKVAAVALATGTLLLTANRRDFEQVPDLLAVRELAGVIAGLGLSVCDGPTGSEAPARMHQPFVASPQFPRFVSFVSIRCNSFQRGPAP